MTPGHTPGHTVYEIRSGKERLIIIGDIIHIGAVQFSRPKTSIDFDIDQGKAVVTRLGLFKKLASDRTLVAGMHLPFPGLGHVREDGPDTYTWVPIQFAPVKQLDTDPGRASMLAREGAEETGWRLPLRQDAL